MPTSALTFDAHQSLKEGTKAVHQQLHRHAILSQLVSPDLEKGTYQRVILAYQSVYARTEENRAKAEDWPSFSLSPCLEALEKDIRDMGLESKKKPVLSSEEPPSRHALLGSLYALHGAQHGAAMIGRKLANSLPDEPRAYFTLGLDPKMWTELTQALSDSVRTQEDMDKLIDGARETFLEIADTVDKIACI